MKIETRSVLVEVRAETRVEFRGVEIPKTFRAMPMRYGVVDDHRSIWTPGVFDGSRLPVLSYGHQGWTDLASVLGHAVDYRDTADGPEYLYEFDDFELVPTAAQAAHQLDTKTLREFSVGFVREVWEGGRPGYRGTLSAEDRALGAFERIIAADHEETSIVIRGSVPGTKLLSVRGATVAEADVLDLARKVAAGELTQEEAKAALELIATDDPPAGTDGDGDDDGDGEAAAEVAAVEALADEILGGI